MKAIVYRLRLLEPLLVAQAGAGEENSAVALPYIPGSVLRGALASRWLGAHPAIDLAADPKSRTCFLDGAVCYLNAYPEIEGERSLPMPASWFTEKDLADDEKATIYDLAVGPDPGLGTLKVPKGGPFCRLERREPGEVGEQLEYQATLVGPLRTDQVHIALEDVNRRGEGNQVFRYNALAPGQSFIGVVVAPEETDLSEIKELLEAGHLIIGSAHTAGYGRVAVEVVEEIERGWREYQPAGPIASDRLIVTLLSPAILRHRNGQVGWDGGQALASSLDLPEEARLAEVFGSMELMGGYNRKWSLPLPQAWALSAGSVFVFAVSGFDEARLQAVAEGGIGERRAEGFGRIAINWQGAAQITQMRQGEPEISVVSLSAESRRQAQEMVQRRLRILLDRELARQVADEASRLRYPPSNAQLSAIRQAALAGWNQKSMQPLLNHLVNLKKAGESQLKRCRLGNQSLFEWLRARATDLDVQAQLLRGAPMPQLAGQAATLTDDLKIEYTARLIDGVMQMTIRRNREARR